MRNIKPSKQKLIAERDNVNYIYYEKVMEHTCEYDSIGLNHKHFVEAKKYVPNHVLKRWTKDMRKEIAEIDKYKERQVRIAEEDANIQRVDAQTKGVKW
tara:strand:- start:219 stop:515 length:297 start_codon:yes stop_codon:yes gene_type:complete